MSLKPPMLPILSLLLTINSVSAHDLTHQSGVGGNDALTNCSDFEGPFNSDERTINHWWNLFEGRDSNLVDILALPENLLSYEEAIDKVTFDDEGHILASEFVCSIYMKPIGSVPIKLCGEVDHFMKAAQSTLKYCKDNYGGVPIFLGPNSFLQAENQTTLGAHHQEYDLSEGIEFYCATNCRISHEILSID